MTLFHAGFIGKGDRFFSQLVKKQFESFLDHHNIYGPREEPYDARFKNKKNFKDAGRELSCYMLYREWNLQN